jgi:phospholipid/cholesterol/gamma-HCH transport system ATP-binding protein
MIELRNVSKSFGGQSILNGVSFKVEDGERVCIIGQSGCGKSVTMKLMTGLLLPDSGSILINGEDTSTFKAKDWARVLLDFGVVFQGAALFSSISVFENICIRLLEERLHSRKEIRELATEALISVGLDPATVMDKYPAELSGGMQKRVGVARAIVHKPKVIFYDEPTTGLDPVNSSRIDHLIESLSNEAGRTSVIITHDMYMVKSIATKVVFLHDQRVHFQGSPQEMAKNQDPEIRAFLSRTF